jgi:glyoxylase-like metal-dependent hydrolase (beta-lactamase superfamily II)
MKLWSILGNSQKLDGGAMFGNVPRALWSQWIAPDAENRIPLACRALLAEGLAGKRVLFETGIGAFFEPKLRERFGVVEAGHVLLDSLAAAGFSHEQIDVVVLSHLHFDHAGGLLSAWRQDQAPSLLFPNARYVVSEACWDRARHPHPRDRASFIPELVSLLEQSGRLDIVRGGSSTAVTDANDSTAPGSHCAALGDAVRFHYSDGHTPGLMLSEIVGPDDHGGVVFCADLIPGRPWVHLPVTMGYDRYPELLIEEKRRFLDDKLARNVRLFFTHDVDCALAEVQCDDKGRYSTRNELARLDALPFPISGNQP